MPVFVRTASFTFMLLSVIFVFEFIQNTNERVNKVVKSGVRKHSTTVTSRFHVVWGDIPQLVGTVESNTLLLQRAGYERMFCRGLSFRAFSPGRHYTVGSGFCRGWR